MTILAYHGTDWLDFTRFDIAEARPFNIGLHFGTRAAALSRIAYLRENGRAVSMRPPPLPTLAALQRRLDRLTARYLSADDNPRYQKDPSLYAAFNARMNVSIRRLFQALGYDGFVYTNELEDGKSAADSYCVFDARQVAVNGEEMVRYGRSKRAA